MSSRSRWPLLFLTLSLMLIFYFKKEYYRSERVQFNPKGGTSPILKSTSTSQAVLTTHAPTAIAKTQTLEIFKKLEPHLQRFSTLQQKILKSEQEQSEYQMLLSNPHLLYWNSELLKKPLQSLKHANMALSFVISSVKLGNNEARQALKNWISDNSFELAPLSEEKRIQGELRAEALYEWSSTAPKENFYIESLLPGPISKKIWLNVLQQQANNEAESRQEL